MFFVWSLKQAVFVDSADNEDNMIRPTRPRALSLSAALSNADGNPDVHDAADLPDFLEVNSIPPLPIYALLAADADNAGAIVEISKMTDTTEQQDYTDLFNVQIVDDSEELELSDTEDGGGKRKRVHSASTYQQVMCLHDEQVMPYRNVLYVCIWMHLL